jgi:hypothetical protein
VGRALVCDYAPQAIGPHGNSCMILMPPSCLELLLYPHGPPSFTAKNADFAPSPRVGRGGFEQRNRTRMEVPESRYLLSVRQALVGRVG